jgi:hypothetical protein
MDTRLQSCLDLRNTSNMIIQKTFFEQVPQVGGPVQRWRKQRDHFCKVYLPLSKPADGNRGILYAVNREQLFLR